MLPDAEVCADRVRVDSESVEEFVIGEVLRPWSSPAARRAAETTDDRHDELLRLADLIAELSADPPATYEDYRVHKLITVDTYKSANATIEAKIGKLKRSRDRSSADAAATSADLPDPSTGREWLKDNERRLLLEMLTPRIVIRPFPKGYSMRPFKDPAREAQRLAAVLAARVVFE